MFPKFIKILILLVFFTSSSFKQSSTILIGKFRVDKDLLLAHFDCKTDVDDILSVAGVATILSNPRFSNVRYHVVAGAYGIQDGLYVPANKLFDTAFGSNWSDAHENFEKALKEETKIVMKTLEKGGDVWIAEAGQSDFTAALIRNIRKTYSLAETIKHIHVVQHSDWNESVTSQDDLKYVKENSSYNKIPDGNVVGNGSPGLKTDEILNLKKYISDSKVLHIWNMAIEIANKYNGKDNRYENPAIAKGGLDFSDVAETCWIFGFNNIVDVKEFFKEFSSTKL
jgi:hypothetical protein